MDRKPRKLKFANRFLIDLVQQNNVDNNLANFTFPDMTTKVPLAIELNQQEFTDLFSSIMLGADLYDYERAIEITALFLTMVDNSSMDLCELIAQCIDTNTTTQAAINNYLASIGITSGATDSPPVPLSTSITGANILPSGYTCDNDHLFGMSRWIVQQLDKSTRQFLGQIELLTDPVELISQFVDNVEIVSWFGGVLEATVWLQDQLLQWYDIAYTQSNEDDLACAIYCLIKDDCTLTIDRIIEAYSQNSFGLPANPNDFFSLMTWLTNTVMSADIGTVATMHYFLAQALRFGSTVYLFDGFRGLKQVIALGKDETDSNWGLLCGGCPPVYPTLELGEWACDFGNQAGLLSQQAPNVWRITSQLRATDRACLFREASDTPFKITSATLVSGSTSTYRGWCLNDVPTINAGSIPLNQLAEAFVITRPTSGTDFVYDITVSF